MEVWLWIDTAASGIDRFGEWSPIGFSPATLRFTLDGG